MFIGLTPNTFLITEIQGERSKLLGGFPRAASYPDYLFTIGGKLNDVGIAVNPLTGYVYVTDYGIHQVWVFDQAGVFQFSIGTPNVAGSDNAHFNNTWGIAINATGYVYVVDSSNNRVQVFDSVGVYQYTIGTGIKGNGNNQFNYSVGIAVNATGHVYVADMFNQRVQVFDQTGIYQYTIGTTGMPGSDNSHFSYPTGVAVNGTGFVYVSDTNNDRVQVFNKAGIYQYTIGVTGVGGSDNAHLNNPYNAAVNGSGFVFVADTHNNRVQVFNSAGNYQYTIGSSGYWGTDNSHLNGPYGVTINGTGHIYVADNGNRRVQVFDKSGFYLYTFNAEGVVPVEYYNLNNPSGIDINKSTGYVYVADWNNQRVQVFDKAGIYKFSICGIGEGSGNNQFNAPQSIAINGSGHVYVADRDNHRVQVFDGSGIYQYTIGETGVHGSDNAHFYQPQGVAINSSGHVFIADGFNNRVQVFDKSGVYLYTMSGFDQPRAVEINSTNFVYVADTLHHQVKVYSPIGAYLYTIGSSQGSDNAHFNTPTGIAVNSTGYLYVADYWNYRVQVFDNAGKYQYTIGTPGVGGIGNDRFQNPCDIAINATNYVYILDFENNRVQVFDKAGIYKYSIGRTRGSDNTHFNNPLGVAVNSTGYIYATDMYNQRVQVFDRFGMYQYTIGETGVPGIDNAHFYNPVGIAINSSNYVYVVDNGNHRIQVFDNAGKYQFTIGVPGESGSDNMHFKNPGWIAINATGHLFITDGGNYRVQVLDMTGVYQFTLPTYFPSPTGIAVNGTGHIFVADAMAHIVVVYNATGTLKFYIGENGVYGGDNAHFYHPYGVAVNSSGYIFVADEYNERVQVFYNNGTYHSTLGEAFIGGSDSTHFYYPMAVAVDNTNGHLYITDTRDHRLVAFGVPPPTGLAITINGGAPDTSSTSVTLTLSATGATEMCFSNDGTTYSGWEAYSPSKMWVLSGGPGPKTVYFKTRCDFTEAEPVIDTINYTLPPILTFFFINANQPLTGNTTVSLGIAATRATEMCFSNNGTTYSDWEPFQSTRSWTIDAISGTRRVYCKLRNGTIEVGPASDTILYVAPPTGLSISINNGAQVTNTTSVTLKLNATGATLMCFSNNGTTYTGWETYSTTKGWTLDGGPGPKTVYFKVDNNTITSGPISSTITYVLNPTGVSLIINDGAAMTASTSVTLVVWASGAEEMCFSNDGLVWSSWEAFTSIKAWGLTGGPGIKTVYFKTRNSTIEVVTPVTASITYTLPPTGLSIIINGGASECDSRTVTITLSVTGATDMCFSNDGVTWSAWEPLVTTRQWNVSVTAGYKTVYFKARNGTIESMAPVVASITYTPQSQGSDNLPPWAVGIIVAVMVEAGAFIAVIFVLGRRAYIRKSSPVKAGELNALRLTNPALKNSTAKNHGDAKG